MRPLCQTSAFAKQYEDRKRIVDAAFKSGDISIATPWNVAAWANTVGIAVAPEWERELTALGHPVMNLRRSSHDEIVKKAKENPRAQSAN
jgi:hypothetical protein